jgi:enoyl-CoA hydratase
VHEQGPILILAINRPHAKNAISAEVAQLLAAAFGMLDERTDLSIAVITGAGGTFCAGMDLKGFARGEIPIVPGRGFAGLVEKPPQKPVIAAVEGHALAGGFEIALACDLIVASDTAIFGLPEVTRGLTANAGGLLRLQHRIPYHIAMELILTGRMMTVGEAFDLRLVNRRTESGHALSGAIELAEQISRNAPLALVTSKRVVVDSADWTTSEMFDRQRAYVQPVRESEDAQEGARAFIEKRAPVWKGQ